MATHLAALLQKAGMPLVIEQRPTPTPGPHELLIDVEAAALNPVDRHQRDSGFRLAHFPSVLGSDVSGIISAVGSAVTNSDLKPGVRVAAFAPCLFEQGQPDYGALQEKVLVPSAYATPLPDSISFSQASLLPMAVLTAWRGLSINSVPRTASYSTADKKAILIWGGSSSVGSATIQVARSLGFYVYTTSSPQHHEYVKTTLGATSVFDRNAPDVVNQIVKTVKDDGVDLSIAFDAVGAVQQCINVLLAVKHSSNSSQPLKIASTVPFNPKSLAADAVEINFVTPIQDVEARTAYFAFVFNEWLKEKLASGDYTPSPKPKIVSGGLREINTGLDELKTGVSGVKLVIEM
jgi:NADPH:quinone reductase-like Zn-dependent oxidoreductase